MTTTCTGGWTGPAASMHSSSWNDAFTRGLACGPYASIEISPELAANWLNLKGDEGLPVAARAAPRIARAIEQHLSEPNRLGAGGPAPTEIAAALARIDAGARELRAGFRILMRAATRSGQAATQYGEASRAMIDHLGSALLGGMAHNNPAKGLEEHAFLRKLLPSTEVIGDEVICNKAILSGFFRLSEQCEFLADHLIPAAQRSSAAYSPTLVRELGRIWRDTKGTRPATSKKEGYLSPFQRLIEAIYGYIAGLHVATWQFEADQQRENGASILDNDLARFAAMESAKMLEELVVEACRRPVPTAGTLKRWLELEGGY